jgi:hypothetical protein
MIRLLDHEMVEELAANATMPVINGLTKWSHPCQVMADVMTFEEHKAPSPAHGGLERRRQQCADQLGPCRGEVRLPLNVASPGIDADAATRGLGEGKQGLVQFTTIREAVDGAPTAWSPTPGCRWATTDARSAARSC